MCLCYQAMYTTVFFVTGEYIYIYIYIYIYVMLFQHYETGTWNMLGELLDWQIEI